MVKQEITRRGKLVEVYRLPNGRFANWADAEFAWEALAADQVRANRAPIAAQPKREKKACKSTPKRRAAARRRYAEKKERRGAAMAA